MFPLGYPLLAALICFYHPLTAQTTPLEPASLPFSTPKLCDRDTQWALVGCYNEFDSNALDRALGVTWCSFTARLAKPDNLTVPLCLDGCGAALAPIGDGHYTYDCVDNSWYVTSISYVFNFTLFSSLIQLTTSLIIGNVSAA